MVDSNACCYVVSDIVISLAIVVHRPASCNSLIFEALFNIEIPSALLLLAMK